VLKLLIPILDRHGALEAARHGAFLFAEHCVSDIELIEVLEPLGADRSSAFHSLAKLRRREAIEMRDALTRTCAILDDAGVPYTRKRVFGSAVSVIASSVRQTHADVIVLDASRLGFLRKWSMLAQLQTRTSTPVTVLH
jgi:nucleotide-binding universal stress UspA family protein